MGIRIPPGDPIYGNDCLNCFAAGRTPQTCWLVIAGVSKGDGWLIGMPESINGTFKLTQFPLEPCHWSYVSDTMGYSYKAAFLIHPWGNSRVLAHMLEPIGTDAFWGGSLFHCKRNFSNIYTEPPPRPFVGGTAIVFF